MPLGNSHPVFSFTSKNYSFFTQNKGILFLLDFSSLYFVKSQFEKLYLKRTDSLPETSVVSPSPRAVPRAGGQEPFLQQLGTLVDQGKVMQRPYKA